LWKSWKNSWKKSRKQKDIEEWIEKWQLYASQFIHSKSLRFWINEKTLNKYKVVYGDDILYNGYDMMCAIKACNNV